MYILVNAITGEDAHILKTKNFEKIKFAKNLNNRLSKKIKYEIKRI